MSKPTVSKLMIRRKIREVLNMRPGFGKTEAFLLEAVNELTGGGVSLQELRDHLEWNHGQRYVRSEYQDEAEETLWFITTDGIAQQKI
jgi:DNA-binding transcriptional regulator YdaS (Cro superfamily)